MRHNVKRPRLFISDFDEDMGSAKYYSKRIDALDIPKPSERVIQFNDKVNSLDSVTKKVQSFMNENDLARAFVKTEFKAAIDNIQKGSVISANDTTEIKRTIESLLAQNIAHSWPTGNYLLVREWADLNFCLSDSHFCHPEVRYFVDDGKIIGRTPTEYDGKEYTCSQQYSYVEDILQNSEPPDELARQAAEEFTEATWGIDFGLTTSGDWIFVEMNFNGVYWNSNRNKWMNMVGQGDNKPYSPLETHYSALPNLD